jgi:hypothetical protein
VNADVIAWLEGEQWSRERHGGQPSEITVAPACWRSQGHRNLAQDPAGEPPLPPKRLRIAVGTARNGVVTVKDGRGNAGAAVSAP